MSLIRSLSRRMSRSGDKQGNHKRNHSTQNQVVLNDTPVPTTRQMTSANLFQGVNSTSDQSTNLDRTLFEIPQPQAVDAMTDHIKNHPNGELFPYVGVVGSEGESPDARRQRLLALKPSYNKREIPEIKVLGCPLISKEGSFTMDNLMSFAQSNQDPIPVTQGPVPDGAHRKNYTISKPYVHIRQVTILFTPNTSSTSNYCNFWMNLVDSRLINSEKGSQTNVIVSNQEGVMEVSCDYCVSIRDLSAFQIAYTLERDIVHPGFQWGTCSFYFSIVESDLPYQSSKVDAMAVYRIPITTLLKRETNADKSDITFTPEDVERLREMYLKGDIVDVDEPKTARLRINTYAKSSIRQRPKGEEIESGNRPGWAHLKGAVKQRVDAYDASVDPDGSDEDLVPEVDLGEISKKRKEAIMRYQKAQEEERLRLANQNLFSRPETPPFHDEKQVVRSDSSSEDEEVDNFFKPKPTGSKKKVRLSVSEV